MAFCGRERAIPALLRTYTCGYETDRGVTRYLWYGNGLKSGRGKSAWERWSNGALLAIVRPFSCTRTIIKAYTEEKRLHTGEVDWPVWPKVWGLARLLVRESITGGRLPAVIIGVSCNRTALLTRNYMWMLLTCTSGWRVRLAVCAFAFLFRLIGGRLPVVIR